MPDRLIPSLRADAELAPFRPGLRFGFYNTLTWQIATGTTLVLFAEQLGATPFQAGLAYAFIFLLTPVQIFATVLLPRLGYKRLTMAGWGLRGFMLLIPLALAPAAAVWGERSWMVLALIGASFGFCLLRAFGMAASLPWFYAILPERARGRYFASDHLLSGVASVATLLACVGLFALLPVYAAIFVQYLIAVVGSWASYRSLARLPDGPPTRMLGVRDVAAGAWRALRRPSAYRSYLLVTVAFYGVSTPLAPYAAYHLKATAGLAPGWIMGLEVLRYLGGIAAASGLRRRVDGRGARPFLLLALGLYLGVAAYWWIALATGEAAWPVLPAVYFAAGAGGTCWMIGNLNYLPKIAPEAERTLLVTTQGACASLAGGLAVTLWGAVLRASPAELAAGAPALAIGAFQVQLGLMVLGCALLSWRLSRLAEPAADRAEPLMVGNALLRPHRALGYLINLFDSRPPADRRADRRDGGGTV